MHWKCDVITKHPRMIHDEQSSALKFIEFTAAKFPLNIEANIIFIINCTAKCTCNVCCTKCSNDKGNCVVSISWRCLMDTCIVIRIIRGASWNHFLSHDLIRYVIGLSRWSGCSHKDNALFVMLYTTLIFFVHVVLVSVRLNEQNLNLRNRWWWWDIWRSCFELCGAEHA